MEFSCRCEATLIAMKESPMPDTLIPAAVEHQQPLLDWLHGGREQSPEVQALLATIRQLRKPPQLIAAEARLQAARAARQQAWEQHRDAVQAFHRGQGPESAIKRTKLELEAADAVVRPLRKPVSDARKAWAPAVHAALAPHRRAAARRLLEAAKACDVLLTADRFAEAYEAPVYHVGILPADLMAPRLRELAGETCEGR
jgi:hypothetical protein